MVPEFLNPSEGERAAGILLLVFPRSGRTPGCSSRQCMSCSRVTTAGSQGIYLASLFSLFCSHMAATASFLQGYFCVSLPALVRWGLEAASPPTPVNLPSFPQPRSFPACLTASSCLAPNMLHGSVAAPVYADEL